MKKILFTSLLLVSSFSYASSDLVQKEVGYKQLKYKITLEKSKNNVVSVMNSFDNSTILGEFSPMSSTNTISYSKECNINKETNEVEINPGNITYGFKSLLKFSESKNKGKYLADYSVDYSELKGIEKIKIGDCQIELPNLAAMSFVNSYEVEIGKETVIATFSNINSFPFSEKPHEVIYKVKLKLISEHILN